MSREHLEAENRGRVILTLDTGGLERYAGLSTISRSPQKLRPVLDGSPEPGFQLADALVVVKPERLIGWHRRGFRLFWRWKSTPAERPGSRPT